MSRAIYGFLGSILIVLALTLSPGVPAEPVRQYTNEVFGFSIPLSEDVRLYTPENPGPFTFAPQNLAILVNKWKRSDLIMVNTSEVTDEKGLADLKNSLESTGLPQPGYRKIAVRETTLGKNQEKRGLEHIFDLQGQSPRTMRLICLVHRGRGLAFVCTADSEHFQATDQTFFEPVLRSVIFD